jgi:hypothetical protein
VVTLEDLAALYEDDSFVDGRSACSEAQCNAGDCDMTWVYTGNDNFEEYTVGGVCDLAAAEAMIAPNLVENWMVNDDLGQMMLQMESALRLRSASNESSDAEAEIRRFKNLKAMTMTLQPVNVTVFGRYCYYGCWCLPNGQHNLASGYGVPVDVIDAVCKEFALCYKCIDIDFGGQCNPEARAYRWGRILDGSGIPIDIVCKDNHEIGPTHRCKRYTCECDRVLAVGLMHVHWYWNVSHHARWGDFDREQECFAGCFARVCRPQDDCCGAYGTASTNAVNPQVRRPYATTNPNTGCCQDVYFFDVENKECCFFNDVVSVVAITTCEGTVFPPDEIDDFSADFPGYSKK